MHTMEDSGMPLLVCDITRNDRVPWTKLDAHTQILHLNRSLRALQQSIKQANDRRKADNLHGRIVAHPLAGTPYEDGAVLLRLDYCAPDWKAVAERLPEFKIPKHTTPLAPSPEPQAQATSPPPEEQPHLDSFQAQVLLKLDTLQTTLNAMFLFLNPRN